MIITIPDAGAVASVAAESPPANATALVAAVAELIAQPPAALSTSLGVTVLAVTERYQSVSRYCNSRVKMLVVKFWLQQGILSVLGSNCF